MGKPQASQFVDSEVTPGGRTGRPGGALGLLRRLADGLGARQRDQRTSAEMTTQPPPTRGQAMREAHRTLRTRMRSHPAIRQVLPHLSAVERHLAKRGSRALMHLPLPVLRKALEQLAVLQRDDESPIEAMNLRVLRLRMIETIALRASTIQDDGWPRRRDAVAETLVPLNSDLARGGDNSDLSSSSFDEAEQAWAWQHQRNRERD